MTPPDTRAVLRKLVGQWTAKAEEDFRDAGTLFSQEPPSLGGTAFHSEQCVEKYLKAFLTAHQVEFPKTHSIKKLLGLVTPIDAGLAGILADAHKLTPYGVDIRYPADFPEMSLALAKEAFDLASKVRDAVRAALGEERLPEDQ